MLNDSGLKKCAIFLSLFIHLLPLAGFSRPDSGAEALYLEAKKLSDGAHGMIDEAKAAELCKQAAQRGDPRALAWQARRMFFGSKEFPKNPTEAQALFLKIEKSLEEMAERDLPDAKRSLVISWGTLFPKEKGPQAFELLQLITATAPPFEWDDLAWFYEEGIGVEKDLKKAFEYYLKSAEAGNGWALNQLGLCYEYGRGVEKDLKKAFEYYLKSAEAGNAKAMTTVGFCYETGNGVAKDEKEMARWYQKAAELGEPTGQGNLGLCYESGRGVSKDEKEAVKWYLKAAEKGDGWALNQLGLCYEYGRGVEKDLKKAFEYYLKSAGAGDAWGQHNVGLFLKHGKGVERDYLKAFEYFKKSADQGNSSGIGNVGLCYETGNGVEKDEKEAVKWYLKAAEKGDGWALNQLGLCYEYGRGVEKDLKKAFEYYLKSAEAGNGWGQNSTATCLYNGCGVEQNYAQAYQWYKKSADQGNSSGIGNVGLCYETGNGVEKDEKEAVKWYLKAAEKGDGWALNQLGLCYEYGRGVEKDPKKAFEFYMKSAEAGNSWGENNLGDAFLHGRGTRQNDKKAFYWFQKAADQENWVAVANVAFCLEFGRGTKSNSALALEKYRQAALQGNDFAKRQIQKLATNLFWEKNYALSSQALEISREFGNPGAAEGLYRNHVLRRESWAQADPMKGFAARWNSLSALDKQGREGLALLYQIFDFGYPTEVLNMSQQLLPLLQDESFQSPDVISALHNLRGYALLAGEDFGPRVVLDGIPSAWPLSLVPDLSGIGYFTGNLICGYKPLECRLRFSTDFIAPGPPAWWGTLGAEIFSWGLQLQAAKESGWYRRLVRAERTDGRRGVDFFWGLKKRENLEEADTHFSWGAGTTRFSSLVGRVVVASQKNDSALFQETTAELVSIEKEQQAESATSEKKKDPRKTTDRSLEKQFRETKPGILPWGNELGELSFGLGMGNSGPGSLIFSHGVFEAGKSLFWPLLLRLKPDWALLGCDIMLKNNFLLSNEAVAFYEKLADRTETRNLALVRLAELHLKLDDSAQASEWASKALQENQSDETRAWLKSVVTWAQYLKISFLMNQAENTVRKNKKKVLQEFQGVLRQLLELQQNHPTWEPTIIRHQIRYVQKRIEEIERLE